MNSIFGGRSLQTVIKAFFGKEHYHALFRMFQVYERPLSMLYSYLSGKGNYPCQINIKTPTGIIPLTLYSHHDLLTVNEIFCREDYSCSNAIQSVIDFGSNIGISALYFLTRNQTCKVKLFEPLPSNQDKLKQTLLGYEDRYTLYPVAVGLFNEEVEFAYESSGRYGGIGKEFTTKLTVPCRNVNELISDISSEVDFSHIDLIKLDIEGLETKVIAALSADLLSKITCIVAEVEGIPPDLPGFSRVRRGPIVRWKNTSI